MSESNRQYGKRIATDKETSSSSSSNLGFLRDSMWAGQQQRGDDKQSTLGDGKLPRSRTQIAKPGGHSKRGSLSSVEGGGRSRNRRNRSEPSLKDLAMATSCVGGIKQSSKFKRGKADDDGTPVERPGVAPPYVCDSIPPVLHKALDRIIPSISAGNLVSMPGRQNGSINDNYQLTNMADSVVDYTIYGVSALGILKWTFLQEPVHFQTGFEYDNGSFIDRDELQLQTKGHDDNEEDPKLFDNMDLWKQDFPDAYQLYRSLFPD